MLLKAFSPPLSKHSPSPTTTYTNFLKGQNGERKMNCVLCSRLFPQWSVFLVSYPDYTQITRGEWVYFVWWMPKHSLLQFQQTGYQQPAISKPARGWPETNITLKSLYLQVPTPLNEGIYSNVNWGMHTWVGFTNIIVRYELLHSPTSKTCSKHADTLPWTSPKYE